MPRFLVYLLLFGALGAIGANFWFDYKRGGFDPEKGREFLAGVGESIVLHDKIDAAKDSVFLVVGRHDNIAGSQAIGTAFLVDNRCAVFATNAHVADLVADEGVALSVKQAENGREWPIRSLKVHPARDLFLKVVDEYGPIVHVEGTTYRPVRAFWGYDAALLYAQDGACATEPFPDLPGALTIAPWEELSNLSAGDPIALIGFHGRGTTTRGFEQYTVTPRVDIGNIRQVGSYIPFIADGKERNERLEQLIQHILPTTPGTSGSPIIGASGHVIAINTGASDIDNEDDLATRERIAHRADIIAELLNGDEARLIADYRSSIAEYLGQFMSVAEVLGQINTNDIRAGASRVNRESQIGETVRLKRTFSDVQDGYVVGERPDNAGSVTFRGRGRYHYERISLDNASAHLIRAMDYDINLKLKRESGLPDYLCPLRMTYRRQSESSFRPIDEGQAPTTVIPQAAASGQTSYEFVFIRPEGCTQDSLSFDVVRTPFLLTDRAPPGETSFLERVVEGGRLLLVEIKKGLSVR